MPSPSASTFFRFVRDPKHDGGGGKPQIARIEADLGVGYRRQDCQGGKTTKGTKEGTEGHEARRGDTITKNTVSLKGEPSTATDTKGSAGMARAGLPGGNRRLRGLRRILGSATADRTARMPDKYSTARGTHLGSAGGEGGRERSAGEARRATGGARKPPAQWRLCGQIPPSLQTSKPPNLQTSKPPNFQTSKLPAPPCVFAVPSRIARTRDGARRFSSGGWPSEDRRLIHPGAAADPPWIGRRSKVINNPTLPAAPAESVSASARGAQREPSRFPLIGRARRRFSPKTPGTFGTLRTRGFFVIVFCKCRSERQRFGIAGGGPWSLAHPW